MILFASGSSLKWLAVTPAKWTEPSQLFGDLAAHSAKRPQSVEGLQRRKHEKADAEGGKAPDQDLAQPVHLLDDGLPRFGDLETPAYWGTRKDCVALGDSKRFRLAARRKLVAVVSMRFHVRVGSVDP